MIRPFGQIGKSLACLRRSLRSNPLSDSTRGRSGHQLGYDLGAKGYRARSLDLNMRVKFDPNTFNRNDRNKGPLSLKPQVSHAA